MGQILSNGVYLPNEGERNCYAGLASNWQILNTAVGNIAEKAPLVHTHTVSQITDFPAYGNAAGTICEGNDSRLSDARTPVAHTHTKSDVTDLLNSNFIPSANNSYDLGSSSYQWNNLYAKNYFYNGTAWGLDKANEWTGNNSFTSVIKQRINSVYSQTPATDRFAVHEFIGTDSNRIFTVNCADRSSGQREISLMVYDTDGIFQGSGLFKESDNSFSFRPRNNNAINLGTSSYKWKTLNGINPGALSLPSETASAVNLDPTNWDISGTAANRYTPPADGWLGVQVMSKDTADLTGQYLFVGRATGGSAYYPEGGTTSINVNSGQGTLMGQVLIPVISGKEYHIRIKIGVDLTNGSSITARFYTCLGNV